MHDRQAPIVMVVDDEEIVDEMIQEILEGYGCRTASYNDPREALRFLEDNAGKVVLLVTDLKMPFLAGPDLIKKAVLINPSLQVIAVSGYVQQYSLDEVRQFIQKVLPKPFLPSEMLDAVERALSNARLQCRQT